jgi:hypothetical protein
VDPDPSSPEEFVLHAWVDESMRAARDGQDGLYLLAAVVADPGGCDVVREGLTSLLLKGALRLHWRDETEIRRCKIAALIGSHDLAHVGLGSTTDARSELVRSALSGSFTSWTSWASLRSGSRHATSH